MRTIIDESGLSQWNLDMIKGRIRLNQFSGTLSITIIEFCFDNYQKEKLKKYTIIIVIISCLVNVVYYVNICDVPNYQNNYLIVLKN